MSEMQHATLPIHLLDGHKRNYRSHPPEQIGMIKASLTRFNQVRSIVVAPESNGRYTILAGHGVVEAAREKGITELSCDIVPESWDAAMRDAYLVADNNITQHAVDDEALLAHLLQEQQNAGFDLAALGSDDETLRQMLEALGDEYAGDEERDEAEDELPEDVETRCKPGDMWQLGRHKIACIDSTDIEQVRRLFTDAIPHMVWSDPPYGVRSVKDNMVGADFGVAKKGKYKPVIGDETAATAIAAYRLCAEFWPLAEQIWWGANYYTNVLPPSNCWLVWDKRADSGIENTFADCELAWTNMTGPSRMHHQLWNGMIREGEHEKRVHPTQKPLKLALWAFERYGKEHDVIYDPFLGSGISVIAAERLGRTVYGCELSPEYIDVIIARWERETGHTATLLSRIEEAVHG